MLRRVWSGPFLSVLVGLFLTLFLIPRAALAQSAQNAPPQVIPWEDGPTVGRLGTVAQITVPQGYRFTGQSGAIKLLELTQNPSSGHELGALVPDSKDDNKDVWFVIFEFNETGYIKDDEKDKLDAAAILKSLQEGTEESNKIRKQRGWQLFHVAGWNKPPFYNPRSNNLTWAIRGVADALGDQPQGESINYSLRILGRRGTMNVDLVLSPRQVEAVVPEFENLMTGFSYVEGQKYAEFRAGDKVAAYGLTALVVGGAAAAAVKSGLLAKFWKVIVLGFIALAGAIKKIIAYIRRMLSGNAAAEDTGTPQG